MLEVGIKTRLLLFTIERATIMAMGELLFWGLYIGFQGPQVGFKKFRNFKDLKYSNGFRYKPRSNYDIRCWP